MNKRPGYSPAVRERAIGQVLTSEHEHTSRGATIPSIATKMGGTPETLRSWLNKMAVDTGATSAQSKRMTALARAHSSVPMRLRSRPLFSLRRRSTADPGGLLTHTAQNTVSSRAARRRRWRRPFAAVAKPLSSSWRNAVSAPGAVSPPYQTRPPTSHWTGCRVRSQRLAPAHSEWRILPLCPAGLARSTWLWW